MRTNSIFSIQRLGFPWQTIDPLLFCVHHNDAYPCGNASMGPAAALSGRNLGQDFAGKDGWNMYHGQTIPGFPAHPHRGFETVTITRRGLINHSDSLGATARFGGGDVQWLTAGEDIARARVLDAQRKATEITCVAGAVGDARGLPPPPDSWAFQAESDLAIWTIKMVPGARWTLPAACGQDTRRMLYFFQGEALSIDGQSVPPASAVEIHAEHEVDLVAGSDITELLVLQGRLIGEPVAQHGPFVMNTLAEIHQAFADYRSTEFGGWPWGASDPVHPRGQGRFARHADGRVEAR